MSIIATMSVGRDFFIHLVFAEALPAWILVTADVEGRARLRLKLNAKHSNVLFPRAAGIVRLQEKRQLPGALKERHPHYIFPCCPNDLRKHFHGAAAAAFHPKQTAASAKFYFGASDVVDNDVSAR